MKKSKNVSTKHIKEDMKEESEIIKAAKKMKAEDVRYLKSKRERR